MKSIRSHSTVTFVIRFLSVALVLLTVAGYAQEKSDSIKKVTLRKRALNEGIRLISANNKDSVINEHSVEPYAEYAGRIIRHIHYEPMGFEYSIYDNSKKIDKAVRQAANALHSDTREKIIKKHLFIRENEKLNPAKVADNERFLRDKDFILDSRIIVTPIPETDSVDLVVVTRDVFSIGGSIGGSPTSLNLGIYDANIDGRAQRLEFTTLIDRDRIPKSGYSVAYRKSSILGSLTNLELSYSEINSSLVLGDASEFSIVTRLTRPLVSSYSRFAGGMEVSSHWSENVYNKPDTTFIKYKHNVFDSWLGYNFGVNHNHSNRLKKFIAIRFFDGYFENKINKEVSHQESKYNNAYGYLTEFTLYRQDFYRTRYVLGFGRTEDIPSGFNLGLTGGYVRQLQIERPYGAAKVSFSEANKKGDFYNLSFQSGAFLRNKQVEDALLQGSFSYYTKVWNLNKYKMRNLITTTYTQLYSRTTQDWLSIDRQLIPGLTTDSLHADKRLSFHLESVLYTPWELLGFHFGPFASADLVSVECTMCDQPSALFWGFSTGFRTRNENLIFGTMEVRFTYVPNDEFGNSRYSVGFRQRLRVKNSGTFVNPPSLIAYN